MFDKFFHHRGWRAALCALVFLGAPFAAACDDSPSTPTSSGTLRVMLTDAPAEAVERVNVFVSSLTVKRLNREPEQVTLNLTPNPVDLLTLRNRVVTLAAGEVPAGQYEWVEIRLDETRSNIVDSGVTRAVDLADETIRILHTFNINENVQTVVTLDFDANASLTQLPNGTWVLSPVIRVTGGNQ